MTYQFFITLQSSFIRPECPFCLRSNLCKNTLPATGLHDIKFPKLPLYVIGENRLIYTKVRNTKKVSLGKKSVVTVDASFKRSHRFLVYVGFVRTFKTVVLKWKQRFIVDDGGF